MPENASSDGSSPALRLRVEPAAAPPFELELATPQLVLAGYTGRDESAVGAHIRELQEHGIAPPPAVPMLWILPAWLLQVGGGLVEVDGDATSGEIEPVLVRLADGRLLVGVGSDHTDRERERDSLLLSKLVCPKIVAQTFWLYEDVAAAWDELRLVSSSGPEDPYQEGALAHIRHPLDVLELVERSLSLDPGRPLVLFLGTVPTRASALSFAGRFVGSLSDPALGRVLSCAYDVADVRAAASFPFADGALTPPAAAPPALAHQTQEEEPR